MLLLLRERVKSGISRRQRPTDTLEALCYGHLSGWNDISTTVKGLKQCKCTLSLESVRFHVSFEISLNWKIGVMVFGGGEVGGGEGGGSGVKGIGRFGGPLRKLPQGRFRTPVETLSPLAQSL